MYFLLEMGIFHCYVSLPKGTFSIHFLQKNPSMHRNHPKILRPSSLVHFGHDPLSHLSHHRWAQRFGHSLHLFAEGQGVIKGTYWMTKHPQDYCENQSLSKKTPHQPYQAQNHNKKTSKNFQSSNHLTFFLVISCNRDWTRNHLLYVSSLRAP